MKNQKHTYRTGIACAVALWILTGCGSPEERAQTYYTSGMQYITSQDYPKAAIEFRNALKLNENFADAWYGMSLVEQQARAWDKAYADLIKVLEIDPKHMKALTSISLLLAVSGDKQAALKYTDTALGLDPVNPDIMAQRATLLYQLGKTQEGVAEASKVLALRPNHPGAIIVIATDRINAKDLPGAMKLVDAALAADPKVLGMHLMKLAALKDGKDLVKLEAAIRTIVATFPEHPEYRSELLSFLTANNRYDDAEKELRSVVGTHPDDPKAALELVAFIDRTKGHEPARQELVLLSKNYKDPFPLLMAVAELDFQAGRFDDAEVQLRELAKLKGTSDEGMQALLMLNEQLISRNKIEDAAAGIAAVLKEDGENVDALKQRAAIAISQGKFEQAIADLRTVLSNTKSDARALALIASAYERNGQMELAESAFVDATQTNLNDPNFALNYVSFLVRRGKQETAQAALQTIVERFPDNRSAMVMLAEMYQRQGDWERATEVGAQLKRRDGADPAPNLIVGQSLFAQRRYDDVINLLGGSVAKRDIDATTMKTLVQAYVAGNRIADAQAYLNTVLKDNPNNTNAIVLQSSLLRREGKMPEAEQRLKDAIKLEPASTHPYVALAFLYEGQNKPDQTMAILKQGVESANDKPSIRFTLAAFYEKAGRVEDAIATYEILRTETPDSMAVANNLASLLTDNRTDQASLDRAAELAKVLKDSPIPEFRETLGWSLFSSNKQKEGLKMMESTISALDKYPAAHYHLGVAYAAVKKNDLAKKEFAAALALQPPADLKEKIELANSKLN